MRLLLKAAFYGALAGTLWTLAVAVPRFLLDRDTNRERVQILVFAHELSAGKLLEPADVTVSKVHPSAAQGSVLTRAKDAVGRRLVCEARAGERVILGCLEPADRAR
jgi:Flp pilus assembly protein CpaB